MKVLFSDIKHFVVARIYVELVSTNTFLTISLCVSISYSIFN